MALTDAQGEAARIRAVIERIAVTVMAALIVGMLLGFIQMRRDMDRALHELEGLPPEALIRDVGDLRWELRDSIGEFREELKHQQRGIERLENSIDKYHPGVIDSTPLPPFTMSPASPSDGV